MTRKQFKRNLVQSIEARDLFVSDEDIEKFLNLNYDEDGDWNWDYDTFGQFTADMCANFGDFWETVADWDLHYPGEFNDED